MMTSKPAVHATNRDVVREKDFNACQPLAPAIMIKASTTVPAMHSIGVKDFRFNAIISEELAYAHVSNNALDGTQPNRHDGGTTAPHAGVVGRACNHRHDRPRTPAHTRAFCSQPAQHPWHARM